MQERIQKIIASAGICSRRKAEELVKQGRVKINNKTAILGNKADINKDIIAVKGRQLEYKEKAYYMLNKPARVIVSKKDNKGRKTIYDLPMVKRVKVSLMPVGRLDYMSEGLLLLTNDGDWANKIAHPRYRINKTYEVELTSELQNLDAEKIRNGIIIEGKKTSKAIVKKIKPNLVKITIHEGRNRIIRKIMDKLGYKIKRLKRIQVGEYNLGTLKKGQIKKINKKTLLEFSRVVLTQS